MKRILLAAVMLPVMGGCLHSLKYELTDRDRIRGQIPNSMEIVVSILDDARPLEERIEAVRTKLGYEHTSDYTYDREFSERVDTGISSMMMAEHLSQAGVFSSVKFMCISMDELDPPQWDYLQSIGSRAVITGKIRSFFGYRQTDAGSVVIPLAFMLGLGLPPLFLMSHITQETKVILGQKITFIKVDPTPGLVSGVGMNIGALIGTTIENSRERDIESKTDLLLRLVSIQTGATLWQDSIIVHLKKHESVGGKSKFDLATESLHEATSKLVQQLSLLTFAPESVSVASKTENYDKASVTFPAEDAEFIIPSEVSILYDSVVTVPHTDVSIKCSKKQQASFLSFEGVYGVDKYLNGSFDQTSLFARKNGTFFIIAKSPPLLLQVEVSEMTPDGVTLTVKKY